MNREDFLDAGQCDGSEYSRENFHHLGIVASSLREWRLKENTCCTLPCYRCVTKLTARDCWWKCTTVVEEVLSLWLAYKSCCSRWHCSSDTSSFLTRNGRSEIFAFVRCRCWREELFLSFPKNKLSFHSIINEEECRMQRRFSSRIESRLPTENNACVGWYQPMPDPFWQVDDVVLRQEVRKTRRK